MRSSCSSYRTFTAATRWPTCGGSNVPPKIPSRSATRTPETVDQVVDPRGRAHRVGGTRGRQPAESFGKPRDLGAAEVPDLLEGGPRRLRPTVHHHPLEQRRAVRH